MIGKKLFENKVLEDFYAGSEQTEFNENYPYYRN